MMLPDLPPTAPPGLEYLLTPPPDPVITSWAALLIELLGRLFGL